MDFLDLNPELMFRIQQKMKEQINKIVISNIRPVNSGLGVRTGTVELYEYEIENDR